MTPGGICLLKSDGTALLKRSFSVILFFAVILFSNEFHAQRYNFTQYSVKEGLSQSQVRCLFQDSRGYIWAGTLGGLSRFNGVEFLNYNRQNGLLNNQINCIIELADGSIAAGSNGSISIVNGKGIQNISLPSQLSEATINTLFEDEEKNLWIGTETGLCIYKDSAFITHEKLEKNHIKSILASSGKIYVLTKESLYIADQKNAELFYSPSDPETNFFDLIKGSDNYWWIATRGEGLVKLDESGKTAINFLSDSVLFTSTITGIIESQPGLFWMSSRYGFFKFDGNKFSAFTGKNGLKTEDVRDLLYDRDGNLWVATYGSGLLKFSGESIFAYTTGDGLASNAIMSILQDKNQTIWLSSFDRGISRFEGDTIVGFEIRELSGNNRVWTSIRDHAGRLWFGSSDGLFRYDGQQYSQFNTEDSLTDNMILSLFEDDQNRLWIGTSKGVTLFENNKFHPFEIERAPKKRVRSIKQDRAGKIWMASNEGVYEYDGNTVNVYTQENGLPENSVYCLEIDSENKVWAGTQNGIAVKGGNEFITLRIDESSASNVINFLKCHGDHMWIGTNNGLSVCSINLATGSKFRQFGLEDGLLSLETNLNSAFIDNGGILWFGTTDGVMCANTVELLREEKILTPIISLEKIQLNLQDQDWSKFSSQLNLLTGLPENLTLKYNQNHLTFYFTGISTKYPGNVKYRYMLEGLDDDWKPVTANNFATYSNLTYGKYSFLVCAQNRDGNWSEPIRYSFEILPPFWLSWWFILLEIVLVSSILGYIIFSRRKAFKAKQEKEWFEIRSKLLALEQQSLNSSMNRHFIFNALNSIQYYINRQDKLAANKYLTDFAKLIRKNLDSSEDTLTTLQDEIERLELYLKLEHMRFKDKFEYRIQVDPTIDRNNIKVPAMMIQPFLENSIWHGLLPKDSPGEVVVDITKTGDRIKFSITDNGIGYENSIRNKTGTDNHISKGMGITQSRIDLIKKATGQNIELSGPTQFNDENGVAGGTRVELIIPSNFHELFSN